MSNIIRSLVLLTLFLLMGINFLTSAEHKYDTEWQIGYHNTEKEQPVQWYPSVIPGAVQLDIMKAENYKQPWWYADNVRQFDWMENVWFTYKTEFKRPVLRKDERLFFFSKGIDYRFKIMLNGETLCEQEGMFTYVDIDLTGHLKNMNDLCVVLYPVPKIAIKTNPDNAEEYRRNARESAKPAVSYGWDWHPRCVTRGIWDETYLTVRSATRLTDVALSYTLNDSLTMAHIDLNVEGVNLSGKSFRWIMKSPNGETVIDRQGVLSSDKSGLNTELASPELWYPNGYGDAKLYVSEFVLLNGGREIDRQNWRTGFRRIRLVMNAGTWEDPQPFPSTRSVAPSGIEVNNLRIFAKGSNWVHPDVFIGQITPERYREQLELAKNAHFNILRVWGGGIVNKEDFFNICDELGILVWQEFPLSCNLYTDKPEYVKVLEQEATSIVKRVKKHACLALWSGGNELFNYWSGMTDQSMALRMLNSVCYHLDPQTPFIYTSPFYGVGHGHYLFYDKEIDKEVFQWMTTAHRTAYAEFGVPSVSNVDVLRSFIPVNEVFPPRKGTAWETHHAFNVWRPESWLELETYKKYFGEPKSLEELVKNSQWMQNEGYKFIFEESRRQMPFCCMAINWCFQEPWPTAANNSLINYPNEPKPSYYEVKKALRPVLASIRIPKFEWYENEDFSCDLFLLNDSYAQIEPLKLVVTLQYDDKETEQFVWNCSGTGPFKNVQGPTVHFRMPKIKSGQFTIHIKAEGKPEYDSNYTFLYNPLIINNN